MWVSGRVRAALLAALAYIVVMGIGMAVMHHVVGYSYEQPEMTYVIGWFELAMSAIAVAAAVRLFGWRQAGFGPLDRSGLGWFAPFAVLAVLMLALLALTLAAFADTMRPGQWGLIVVTLLTTLLVGFSEELMFRGVVLRAFVQQGQVLRGIVVSAITFSLLHSVNILGGLPPEGAAAQLALTALFGFAMAPLALRLNNLWPLIIFHWLWDFSLIGGSVIGLQIPVVFISLPLELAVAALLWRQFARRPQPAASA